MISVGSLSISQLGVQAFDDKWLDFALLTGVMVFFMFGCVLCGLFIGKAKFKVVQPYGPMLIFEGVLITLVGFILTFTESLANEGFLMYPIALALGIQNSMCTAWGGAVVRTTHFTGLLTDIGIVTGLWARYKFKGQRRVANCYLFSISLPIMIGYMIGALLGTLANAHLHDRAFFIPGASLIIMGIVYRLMYKRAAYFQYYRWKRKQKAITIEEVARERLSGERAREPLSEASLEEKSIRDTLSDVVLI
eukprot:TRINITY_DN7284_c0_g1_i3.p1 TRINITY_DN7284_c0_g1~~TRINITY_DN7284_c0_g1_i3.p1  ORF type:complete len:250 (-),score=8.07 TRINITY_DN7284_c0_g1_i3:86-835(-)